MTYTIRKDVMADVPTIEVEEPEYLSYKVARTILMNAFAIEENYEVLISSYEDFEKELASETTSQMVRGLSGYSHFFEVRLRLNKRLVSMLTSARLYLDTLYSHVRACLPEEAEVDLKPKVKMLCSSEYDTHLEYRFMEALRNNVQHRGLPVHMLSAGSRWTSMGPDGLLEYSMEIRSDRLRLASSDFKAKVLAELPASMDLKTSTRRYIESLSSVQAGARRLTRTAVEHSRRTIEAVHNKYKEVYNLADYEKHLVVGLTAYQGTREDNTESIPLLLDWDDIRQELERRNQTLTSLTKRYIR